MADLTSGLTPDLGSLSSRSRAQQAAFDHGIRSSAWASLRDEHGEIIGFVLCGATIISAFENSDLRELESLTALISAFVRPALLIEQQEADRRLLTEEADLLAAVAAAETEQELFSSLADGVRRALDADLSLLLVDSPSDKPSTMLSSPPDALSAQQWRLAREALASGGNGRINERSRSEGLRRTRPEQER
jgi:hypothetical protein